MENKQQSSRFIVAIIIILLSILILCLCCCCSVTLIAASADDTDSDNDQDFSITGDIDRTVTFYNDTLRIEINDLKLENKKTELRFKIVNQGGEVLVKGSEFTYDTENVEVDSEGNAYLTFEPGDFEYYESDTLSLILYQIQTGSQGETRETKLTSTHLDD